MMREYLLKHRHIIAYLILAFGVVLAIGGVKREAVHRSNAVEKTGEDSRAAVAAAGGAAVSEGCRRDQQTITQLRLIIAQSQVTLAKLLKDGTITQKTYDDFSESREVSLKLLVVPDCTQVVSEYYKAIAVDKVNNG